MRSRRGLRSSPWIRLVAGTLFLGAGLVLIAVRPAAAAGTAYAVDTAEVGDRGNCKVEAWTSWARNGDGLVTAAPACVISNMPRMEWSSEFTRARTEDDWLWAMSPKVKVNLIPTAIGRPGLAAASGLVYDATLKDTTSVFAYLPATLRLSDKMRINASGGWSHDRLIDRHFATYGAGFDWLFAPKFSMTIEGFGQLGGSDLGWATRPRFQAGLRYRPVDNFSTDLIYGRNINGEGSHWITLSTTVRFVAF